MRQVPGPAELQGDGTELRTRRPPAVDLNDGAGELGGGALGVVLPLEDAVEELSALAELHDEVQAIIVLAHLAQPQHPTVAELRHAVRDLHFPARRPRRARRGAAAGASAGSSCLLDYTVMYSLQDYTILFLGVIFRITFD